MNLYLIGYRGSGKSSVAYHLATFLGWDCFDTDREIEILTGQSIADIFETDGETVFRDWETTVLQAVSNLSERVVSLGGGAPLSETNRQLMSQTGSTVWLRAEPKVLWERIRDDEDKRDSRPALSKLDGLEEVKTILEQRKSVYAECADCAIDTDTVSPEQIARTIANWFDPVDK